MPYFNNISEKIRKGAEYQDFRLDVTKKLTLKERETLRPKYYAPNTTNEASIEAFVNALPGSYKPNLTVLESQRRVQPQAMEVITDTEIDLSFSPLRKACLTIGGFGHQRAIGSLAAYIDVYGSDDTKEALYEVINTKPFDGEKFRNEFNKYAPGELMRAADHMVSLNRRIASADTPEKKLALYREVRTASSMGCESVPLFDEYKNSITPEEHAELDKKYGSIYLSSSNFLTEVNNLAHPLALSVDYNALKKVPETDVFNAIQTNLVSRLNDSADARAEIITLNEIGNAKNNDLAGWKTAIRNQVGAQNQDILYRTISGKTGILDAESMDALYEAGDPFYAIPIEEAAKKDPVLCQPFFGNKLLVGEEIADPPEFPVVENPEKPSFIEFAVDSIISAVGSVFGKEWGLSSVRKYEADLERYQEAERLRSGVTRSMVYYNNSMDPANLKAAQNDLVTRAKVIEYGKLKEAADEEGLTVKEYQEKQAQLKAEREAKEKAQAEAKEKARLEAEAKEKAVNEKKEGLKELKLNEKDMDFMAKFQFGFDNFKKGIQTPENPTADDLAKAFVAFSEDTKMDFEFKRLVYSEDKSLSKNYDKAKKYVSNPEKYFGDAAVDLSNDRVYQDMTKNLSPDQIKAMCKQPVDAKVASELSKFALEYKNRTTKSVEQKTDAKELQQQKDKEAEGQQLSGPKC